MSCQFLILDISCHFAIGNWQHWTEKVPDFIYPNDSIPEFSSILVPNVDNTRTNFLIDTIAKQNKVLQLAEL